MKNYPYEQDGELLIDTKNAGTIKLSDLEKQSEIIIDGNIVINDQYKGEKLPDIIADGHIFIQDNTSISETSGLFAEKNVNISGNSLSYIERIESNGNVVVEKNEFLEGISAVSGNKVDISGDNIKSLSDHHIGMSFPVESKGDLTIICPELKEIGSIECGGNAFISGPSCVGSNFDAEKKLDFSPENHIKGNLEIKETTIGECDNFTIGGDFYLLLCANLDDTITNIRCDGEISTNDCSLSFSDISANKIELSGDLISVTDAKAYDNFICYAGITSLDGIEAPMVTIENVEELQSFDNIKGESVYVVSCPEADSVENLQVGKLLSLESSEFNDIDITFTSDKGIVESNDITSLGEISGKEVQLSTPSLKSLGSLDVDSIDISECESLSKSEVEDIEDSVENVKKNTALKM